MYCGHVLQWIRDFSWELDDVLAFAKLINKAPKDQTTLDDPALTLELLRTSLVIKEAGVSEAVTQVNGRVGRWVDG